ncbi:MAG: hypothetical protein AAGG07_01375 [Planctomycetota bacterium]
MTHPAPPALPLSAIACLALASPTVQAQSIAPDCEARANALAALYSPLTLEANDVTLRALLDAIEQSTGLDLKVAYLDERGVGADGLDPEALVSVTAKDAPIVSIINAALEQAAAESFAGPATWQLTPLGTVELAPRDLLNRSRRLEVYDVADLIAVVPDYPNGPEIDLAQALSASQGGGGQSPITDDNTDTEKPTQAENAEALIEIITTAVEQDQWVRNGGDGASVRLWKTNLLISAPDYVHRQIAGYRCRD